ncbi:MAG: hypothetical protein P8046_09415 [Anaerolineales bacterium]|jgi:hypothetical protein
MKRSYLIIGIALAAALLITTGFVQSTVFADNQQLPYKAGGPENVVQEAPHPDCGPGKLKVEVQGGGQGTYFGDYTIVRHHCFNISDGSITDGYFEQTAANGDMAWGTYMGSFAGVVEADENGNPTVIMINSPWEITGGTGRFAGAEGAGDAVGVFDLVNETGEFTMDGWISFDASN